ncbi:pyridoxal-phosphate dependent enzyme [Chitinophaga pendula]|uniref:1-aminocyclopropane-1-carboxylate deaminase/D-cysteine desulfhydrase n=1 Tax=Chitinophaga TaxID=79328 RepID=UPI000BAE908F|nr:MULTISPECIES: pyridoxal-phosphate dependent enzyme [Chitinophaga]ASZ11511.1 1-aminocyclopropane-1-carboxylate deaminase [Chitinophaga sp. MD30]UCJ05477.1 pyridoxal-phosphate dependent enzyme [Chitinophaga pendula]
MSKSIALSLPAYTNITLQYFTPTWLPGTLQAAMLRLDLLDPDISGNKWFKLRYNLELAAATAKSTILTFGGAYSNHIAATAVACRQAGMKSIGIIRGEAAPVLSHTLIQAQANGMQLQFVSREDYRRKEISDWQTLFPEAYIVPEGGHNAAGAKGCEDILTVTDTHPFTHIICACGTGTTMAGLINSATPHQEVLGFATLKGAQYLEQAVSELLHATPLPVWQLLHDHHLGGYARTTPDLIAFINDFYAATRIPLDIVYTGKMLYGCRQEIANGRFPEGSKLLFIHSGGLQGNLSLPPGVLSF